MRPMIEEQYGREIYHSEIIQYLDHIKKYTLQNRSDKFIDQMFKNIEDTKLRIL